MSSMGTTLDWRAAAGDLADGWRRFRLLVLGLLIGGIVGSGLTGLVELGSPLAAFTAEPQSGHEWRSRPPPREWLLHRRPIAVDRMFRRSR